MTRSSPAVSAALFLAGTAISISAQTPTPSPAPPNPIPAATAITPAPQPSPADVEKGQALIEQAVESLGGAKVIDGIRSLEIHSRSTRLLPDGKSLSVRTTTWIVFPDQYRQDVTTPAGVLSTLLGGEGAFVSNAKKSVKLPDVERAGVQQSVMRNPIAFFKLRSREAFNAYRSGGALLEGVRTDVVKTQIYGLETTLYLDPKGILRRMEYGAGPGEAVRELWSVTLGDYRPIRGLLYPFRSSGEREGQKAFTSSVDRLVVNGAVDPRLFEALLPEPLWRPAGATERRQKRPTHSNPP